MKAQVYVIDSDVPFLCRKKTLEQCRSKLDKRKRILETFIKGDQKNFRMITTNTRHYGKILETHSKGEKDVMHLEDRKEDLTSLPSRRLMK